MFENFIRFLIAIVFVVGCFWLALWVFEKMGIMVPGMVVNCGWVIVVLIIILFAWRAFGSLLGGFTMFPPRQP